MAREASRILLFGTNKPEPNCTPTRPIAPVQDRVQGGHEASGPWTDRGAHHRRPNVVPEDRSAHAIARLEIDSRKIWVIIRPNRSELTEEPGDRIKTPGAFAWSHSPPLCATTCYPQAFRDRGGARIDWGGFLLVPTTDRFGDRRSRTWRSSSSPTASFLDIRLLIRAPRAFAAGAVASTGVNLEGRWIPVFGSATVAQGSDWTARPLPHGVKHYCLLPSCFVLLCC